MSDCLHKAVKLHPQLYFTLVFFGKRDTEIVPWPFPVIISLCSYRRDRITKRVQHGFPRRLLHLYREKDAYASF